MQKRQAAQAKAQPPPRPLLHEEQEEALKGGRSKSQKAEPVLVVIAEEEEEEAVAVAVAHAKDEANQQEEAVAVANAEDSDSGWIMGLLEAFDKDPKKAGASALAAGQDTPWPQPSHEKEAASSSAGLSALPKAAGLAAPLGIIQQGHKEQQAKLQQNKTRKEALVAALCDPRSAANMIQEEQGQGCKVQ